MSEEELRKRKPLAREKRAISTEEGLAATKIILEREILRGGDANGRQER
ncbi:MAG TPA: hypothetical protein PLK30_12545 [Blastocatellia bacterium]|nr:hypothetical protein [Blastocatellia bacterium]